MRNLRRSSSLCPESSQENYFENMEQKFLETSGKSNFLPYEKKLESKFEHIKNKYDLCGAKLPERDRKIYNITLKLDMLSMSVERWATNRHKLIKLCEESSQRLESIKTNLAITKLIFSCADIATTTAALLLKNVKPFWASAALTTATVSSCLCLTTTLAGTSMTRQILNEINNEICEDFIRFTEILRWFRNTEELNGIVHRLFPYGIDTEFVKNIQNKSLIKEDYDAMKSLVPKLLIDDDNEINNSTEREKIYSAVLISNYRRNPNILENEDFVYSAKSFSKTPMAHMWWNRIKFQETLKAASNGRSWNFEIERYSESLEPFAKSSLPLLKFFWMPVGGMILMSALVAFDAFRDLQGDGTTKHSESLRKLARCLRDELDTVNQVHEKLHFNYS